MDKENVCSVCQSGENVQSTYCGSMCDACLDEHVKECEICAKDFKGVQDEQDG